MGDHQRVTWHCCFCALHPLQKLHLSTRPSTAPVCRASPVRCTVSPQPSAAKHRVQVMVKTTAFQNGASSSLLLEGQKATQSSPKAHFLTQGSYTSLTINIWLYQTSVKYKSKCFSVSLFLQKDSPILYTIYI